MINQQAFFNELICQEKYSLEEAEQQDILIVIHNQLDYVKECIESVIANTRKFHLYLWDNGSDEPTSSYLQEVAKRPDVTLIRQETNIGFIIPNNRLAEIGKSPWITLLNSDTNVRAGWDNAMIGFLKCYPDCLQVGYSGGVLNEEGRGIAYAQGYDVDFISGWCFTISRNTFNQFGLFDEKNLKFAYGEDSDFSLRLRTAGHKTYALFVDFVTHYGNKTITTVQHERDTTTTFILNHQYIKKTWNEYLKKGRVRARS